MSQRVVAAGVAGALAAFVVNPLDIVKVRMQTQATKDAGGQQSAVGREQCLARGGRLPVRHPHVPDISRVVRLQDGGAGDAGSAPQRLLQSLRALAAAPASAKHNIAPGDLSACICATAADGTMALQYEMSGGDRAVLRRPWACAPTTCWEVGGASPAPRVPGTLSHLRQIARQEGLASLWRGLDTSLVMSVPTVLLFYPLYDVIMAALLDPAAQQKEVVAGHAAGDAGPGSTMSAAAPFVAGMASRTITMLAVSPLEYVRIQQHAAGPAAPGATSQQLSTWQVLRSSLHGGPTGAAAPADPSAALRGPLAEAAQVARSLPRLWTGLGATLARDLPFSALYWGMVEPIRSTAMAWLSAPRDGDSSSAQVGGSSPSAGYGALLTANLLAGTAAGAAAAAVTTPFDVVKTQLQLSPTRETAKGGVLGVMRDVWRAQGVRGLFVGTAPRALRAAPACAIVISSYELLKSFLSEGP